MDRIITLIQSIIGVALIVTILLQQRGTALGGAFGGDGGVYRTRRGVEKFIFRSTIILAILFIIAAIVRLKI